MTYKVSFDVNGTVKSIKCESVKVRNMFLQCFAETAHNDNEKVSYIPFDAVLYINHTAVDVTDLDGGTDDLDTLAD